MKITSELPVISTSTCDVLVIGGGPAGSTAAALLAERGHRVTLLEKAHHPRFHIGESLLPANLPLLEKLGVADEVKAIGMEKWGAEFVSPWHEHKQAFEFADAMDKSMPMAYQVRRSEFDEILIRNAARKNARVVEGCQVHDVNFSTPGLCWTRPVAILFWATVSKPSNATSNTIAPRFTVIFQARSVIVARQKAISPYSGSIMAGSGLFHWPTAPPASAQ